MTGVDHEHSAAVEEAARWLAGQRPRPCPVVPELRKRFGLTAPEACEACSLAGHFEGQKERAG